MEMLQLNSAIRILMAIRIRMEIQINHMPIRISSMEIRIHPMETRIHMEILIRTGTSPPHRSRLQFLLGGITELKCDLRLVLINLLLRY